MIALLQQRGESDSGWLFQIAFIVFFFVLPILRTIFERKKAAGKGTPSTPTKKAEGEGGVNWKDLLEGRIEVRPRQPEPPAETGTGPQARAVPPVSPATSTQPQAAGDSSVRGPVLSQRSSIPAEARSSPSREPSLRVRRRKAPLPTPEQPTPLAPRERVSDRKVLGSLGAGLDNQPSLPSSASASSSSLGGQSLGRIDSGPLHGESSARWSDGSTIGSGVERPASPKASVPAQGAMDPVARRRAEWRRAIVMSELIAPPLALRGPTSAWPGPPAAFASGAPPR